MKTAKKITNLKCEQNIFTINSCFRMQGNTRVEFFGRKQALRAARFLGKKIFKIILYCQTTTLQSRDETNLLTP